MSHFDVVKDIKGKEYLVFDSSELYDESQIGNKLEDFEILGKLGKGAFGEVFKVLSKLNNKVYAMKRIDLKKLREKAEKKYNEDLQNAKLNDYKIDENWLKKLEKTKNDPIRLAFNETEYLKDLNHPHIIKYYSHFKEGDSYLYIIIEFARNGDLQRIINANKVLNKYLKEEELWNIFLQCMDALSYIHSMGVIHRDIKPENLFIDSNMSIKLGDFGVSAVNNNDEDNRYLNAQYNPFKQKENLMCHGTYVGTEEFMAEEVKTANEYDQRVDVYSMGISFFSLCFFYLPKYYIKKNINQEERIKLIENNYNKDTHYSKELLNIIALMLEEPNKRKASKEIYDKIKDEYSKKYIKNSSIDSIVRCLYSLIPLTQEFLQFSQQEEIKNMPVTDAYIQCLLSVIDTNFSETWNNSINYFRQILSTENPKLQGTKEIEPRFVFAFLLAKLHKELSHMTKQSENSENKKEKPNKYLIISGEEECKTSKLEMMLKFVNEFSSNFKSFISDQFLGLMKSKNICNICKLNNYSFSSFFFVTFNLENILKNDNKISILNLEEQFKKQNNDVKIDNIYCNKCLNKTKHKCFKKFYSFPNFLIISIQRGITYNYKTPINISEQLDLSQYVELEYSKKKYNLVSFLERIDDDGNERFFSVLRHQKDWYKCEGIDINGIGPISNYKSNGDIIMMFYMYEN